MSSLLLIVIACSKYDVKSSRAGDCVAFIVMSILYVQIMYGGLIL